MSQDVKLCHQLKVVVLQLLVVDMEETTEDLQEEMEVVTEIEEEVTTLEVTIEEEEVVAATVVAATEALNQVVEEASLETTTKMNVIMETIIKVEVTMVVGVTQEEQAGTKIFNQVHSTFMKRMTTKSLTLNHMGPLKKPTTPKVLQSLRHQVSTTMVTRGPIEELQITINLTILLTTSLKVQQSSSLT